MVVLNNKKNFVLDRKCIKYAIDTITTIYFKKELGYIYKEYTSSYGVFIRSTKQLLELTSAEIPQELLDEIDAFNIINKLQKGE